MVQEHKADSRPRFDLPFPACSSPCPAIKARGAWTVQAGRALWRGLGCLHGGSPASGTVSFPARHPRHFGLMPCAGWRAGSVSGPDVQSIVRDSRRVLGLRRRFWLAGGNARNDHFPDFGLGRLEIIASGSGRWGFVGVGRYGDSRKF